MCSNTEKVRQAKGRNDEPWPFLWSLRRIWLQCANGNGRTRPQIIPMFAACTVHTGRSWSIAATSKEKIVWIKSIQTTSITFLPMLVSCHILKSFNRLVLSKLKFSNWLIFFMLNLSWSVGRVWKWDALKTFQESTLYPSSESEYAENACTCVGRWSIQTPEVVGFGSGQWKRGTRNR
jgi:hypothetical protein